MDRWLSNIRENPHRGIARNKPAGAVDACYDQQGRRMFAGEGVWNGILDRRAPGNCTQAFPLYSTSRIVAGAPLEGGIYRCALKSVERAIWDGSYGDWRPDAQQAALLKRIFPQGVCDYSRPDQARP